MDQKIHFYMVSAILILGFFVLLTAFLMGPKEADINAKFISPQFECSDGTPVGKCSEEYLGNMCKLKKQGPTLSYSPDCYE